MARLFLTLTAVLALIALFAEAKEVVLDNLDDNDTNSSIELDGGSGGSGGGGGGNMGDDDGSDDGSNEGNGEKGSESNATSTSVTVEFQVGLDVPGKTIEELRNSSLFMGALKTVGAQMANTTTDAVNVTLTGARRLGFVARRLAAVTADYVIMVPEGGDASALAASVTNQGSIESITTMLDAALLAAGIGEEFNTTVTSPASTPVTTDPNANQNNGNESTEMGEASKAAGSFGAFSSLVASAAAFCSAMA